VTPIDNSQYHLKQEMGTRPVLFTAGSWNSPHHLQLGVGVDIWQLISKTLKDFPGVESDNEGKNQSSINFKV